MLLELTCNTCGSPDIIIDDNEYNRVVICKNPECDDFNCFIEFNEFINGYFGKHVKIKEGLTGELTFENEEGKWRETYKNGEISSCEKVE